MNEIILISFVGSVTGFISGMFGIAGSVLASPLLRVFLQTTPIVALATPILSAVPSSIAGSIHYHKKGLINYKAAFYSLILAIPFTVLGTYTTKLIDGKVLIIAKAVFLFILGVNFFIWNRIVKAKIINHDNTWRDYLFTGSIAGFIAGILAVGGGIVFVTAFVRINGFPMKNAIATSLFCIGILSIINSIGQIYLGHVDLRMALIIAVAVIPFSYLGAKTAVKLKNRTLEKIFGSLMIIFSIYFIFIQI